MPEHKAQHMVTQFLPVLRVTSPYTKAKMSTHVVQHESYVYHSLVCIAVKPTGLAQL